MAKQNVIKTYPELDEIATNIVLITVSEINNMTRNIESEMPYKAQYVLEEVIKKLEELV
jgi:hypothetical protein